MAWLFKGQLLEWHDSLRGNYWIAFGVSNTYLTEILWVLFLEIIHTTPLRARGLTLIPGNMGPTILSCSHYHLRVFAELCKKKEVSKFKYCTQDDHARMYLYIKNTSPSI